MRYYTFLILYLKTKGDLSDSELLSQFTTYIAFKLRFLEISYGQQLSLKVQRYICYAHSVFHRPRPWNIKSNLVCEQFACFTKPL